MSWKQNKNTSIQKKIKSWPVLDVGQASIKKIPSISEKSITLPEISNPLHRLKELLESNHPSTISHTHSLQYCCINGHMFREKRISLINDVIKTCENEKGANSLRLILEINRSENQLQNVVKSLDHFTKKEQNNLHKRKRESEYYMSRFEMKKMIEELRAFTKHRG